MTTTTAPRMGELLAIVGDPERAREAFADDAKAKQFAADWDTAQSEHDKSVLKQAQDQTASAIADLLREDVNRPNFAAKEARGENYNDEADGAKIEGIFAKRGEFYRAAWEHQRDPGILAKRAQVLNAMRESVPADGGLLVPESIREGLLSVALESALVRPRAVSIPMATSRVKIPGIDSTSNASSVFGGVVGYWTAEEAAITESTPKFGEVVLDANKLTAYCTVTRELLQDSPISVEGILNNLVPKALAHFEDVKFIRGLGAGEPLGFLNAPAKVEVAKETNQKAKTIYFENLLSMYQRLLPGSHGSAVWVANPNCMRELRTMALSVGTGGSAVYAPDASVGMPTTLLGRPIIYSEKMSTLGDAGDIALVDFNYYLIGDRQQMTAETSKDFLFSTDKVAYKFIERLDGRPSLMSAITPTQGTDTLTAFVTLAARA